MTPMIRDRDEIVEKVRRIVSKCLGYNVHDDASLKGPLTDDLLNIFIISEALEETFGITLSEVESDNLANKTVRKVAEFVQKKLYSL